MIEQYQLMIDKLLCSLAPYPQDRFAGKGIVICGGGDRYFPCVWVLVKMLRRLGCELPIELWHKGPGEMNSRMKDLMAGLGVDCVDAFEVAREHPVRRLYSWELKPYSIINSRFEKVLYIDADNMPLRDPEFLFSTEEFESTGAVFWPDRYMGRGEGTRWLLSTAWEVCRVPFRDEPEIEAGQLVINKQKCWAGLQLTMHINEHSDFYYQYFYGDKDTFHLAWRRVGLDYSLVPHRPVSLGTDTVILQFGFDGQLLFQHRNQDKWKLDGTNQRINGFALEDLCLGFLAELGQLWSGKVRNVPEDFTPVEREAYDHIVRSRLFLYTRVGYDKRTLEFLPDFRIGSGSAQMELGWALEEDKDGNTVLVILSDGGPTCYLSKESEDVWQGRWLIYERMPIELKPVER
jgi:hypothetical protein